MNQRDPNAASSSDISTLAAALDELLGYLAVRDRPEPADVILGLGSDCRAVADRVVELFGMGLAPWVLFTGGRGRLTGTLPGTEAGFLRDVAIERGLPSGSIILEEESKNMLENFLLSAALLAHRHITPKRAILVTQPVLQRRAWATAQRQWLEVEFLNCPPEASTILDRSNATAIISLSVLAVGEIQRLQWYAANGHVKPQDIPPSVTRAYQT
jgi:uncharacterized SAM-binding protein YcdF (DUF218 family)